MRRETMGIPELVQKSITTMMGKAKLEAIADALSAVTWTGSEAIVEIGVYRGCTTVFMAKVMGILGKTAPIYCIDPFEKAGKEPYNGIGDRKAFDENLRAAGVTATVIPKPSATVARLVPDNIGFLSIDGSHLYENAAKDLKFYTPKVVVAGRIFVDDYCRKYYPGVVKALDEFLPNHPEFHNLGGNQFVILLREGPSQ